MKKQLYFSILAALAFLQACKNPTENLNVSISPDVIKYMVDVKVVDLDPNVPIRPNASIAIGGKDAGYVYNIAGEKNLNMENGQITLGIDPARIPTDADPLDIIIQVDAEGYLPEELPLKIGPQELTKSVTIPLVNMWRSYDALELEIKSFKLQNGAISSNAFVKAKTTEDSAYYDDGLTTVVLPKGTKFYYYNYEQTGTYRGVKLPLNTQPDTAYVNGKMYIGTVSTPYQDTIEYPRMGYVKKFVTGNDSLVVAAYYATGYDVDVKFSYPGSTLNGQPISILNGATVRQDELLYESAVAKRLANVSFIAYVNIDGARRKVNVLPDAASKWFTSYKLKQNMHNPITGQPLKEGDSLEVGVNPYEGKTMRTVVKKAANGDLRVESQATEVGFYYKANYTYEFAYNFTMYTPSSSDIPDPENLTAYGYIDLGKYGMSLPLYYYNGSNYSVANKIASKDPIKQNDCSVTVYYADQFRLSRKVPLGDVNVYEPEVFNGLPPAIDFTCRFYCEKGEAYVYPSALLEVYANNRLFKCRFVNGKWATRGMVEGDMISAQAWIGNYYFNYNNVQLENPMLIEKDIPGNESICM